MTVLEYLITYPDDPLSLALKRSIDRAIRKERLAMTLSWWVPL